MIVCVTPVTVFTVVVVAGKTVVVLVIAVVGETGTVAAGDATGLNPAKLRLSKLNKTSRWPIAHFFQRRK